MKLYATEAELSAWMSPAAPPENAAALLRSASSRIRTETRSARYATDADGYPTDTALRQAFREAVCAQVKFWADHQVDPALGRAGVTPAATSKSIGGATITYEQGATAAKVEAVEGLAPDAYYLLADAGLLGGMVQLL
ncbi:hypothetical protein FBY30_2752 [Arthrobacter sp. SLBN-83]|uniref:hypothetical protein n=1 Tax=Arthrobacter sp. SLBN-83 TaxID=2768449 RepID=UPI001151D0B8|nr:hypothetical protein [Arthrobacter sp. SLBN-83]TQJ60484.1 hypothetical protein FBY30_2752 [Arthrobacter sp. SLBN-83]